MHHEQVRQHSHPYQRLPLQSARNIRAKLVPLLRTSVAPHYQLTMIV